MICFTAITSGQASIETDKADLKELILNSFDDIWSELNSKNMDQYYTKDFLLLENGEVWNNDSIANYLDHASLKQNIPNRVNSIDVIEIKVTNGMAWIAYRNHATFTIDHKIVRNADWLESANAILTENGWRLEMLHSTVIEKE